MNSQCEHSQSENVTEYIGKMTFSLLYINPKLYPHHVVFTRMDCHLEDMAEVGHCCPEQLESMGNRT